MESEKPSPQADAEHAISNALFRAKYPISHQQDDAVLKIILPDWFR
jgi:hypothetical protein